ncbi:putative leucine-rich repeat-containing protein DDB_G0290503 [Spodoptera litura]|uniref:Leucine-rich repeat-containing protein DDB_G0290503 n=1 Tax=Spodoptera litura TaxID=69820 RepID=A0A9J7ECI4_SPOLT|nr:putative leucine-rich repeat-containing protein DDB_G0290503 [Spodoptera litura]
MFRPEDQQVEICLLKSNLEEIENELVIQRSALPALDAENEQKYRETMTALRVTRSMNTEIERLKLENVRLTAKRMQLKRQSDDITKSLERAREDQSELAKSVKQEAQETELIIRQYEDLLEEISNRFRNTRGYYNEEEINKETENVNSTIIQLTDELEKRQCMVNELKSQLSMIQPAVPEDILTIFGKQELDNKVQELSEKLEALIEKRKILLQNPE